MISNRCRNSVLLVWIKKIVPFHEDRCSTMPYRRGKNPLCCILILLSSCVWMYVHTLLRVQRTIVTNGNVQDLISVSFMGIQAVPSIELIILTVFLYLIKWIFESCILTIVFLMNGNVQDLIGKFFAAINIYRVI